MTLPFDVEVEIIRPDQLDVILFHRAQAGWVPSGGISKPALAMYEKDPRLRVIMFMRVNMEKLRAS